MKNGILLTLLLAAVFCSCKTESGGPIDTSDPESLAPDYDMTVGNLLPAIADADKGKPKFVALSPAYGANGAVSIDGENW